MLGNNDDMIINFDDDKPQDKNLKDMKDINLQMTNNPRLAIESVPQKERIDKSKKPNSYLNQQPQYFNKGTNGFGVTKAELIQIVSLSENRNVSEETDELERLSHLYQEENSKDYYTWLYKALKTDRHRGLEGDDFEERKKAFGHNQREEVPLKSYWQLLSEALEDFTLRILIVAAIFSIIAQEATAKSASERKIGWVEGFAILVAVFVCSNVAAANDYSKAKQFQKLNKVAEDTKKVMVIRKGEKIQIHQDFIMVGDIVQLRSGMEIPGDGIVVEAADLTADESVMTGEPDPVHKDTIYKSIERRNQMQIDGQKPDNRHEIPNPVLMSGTTLLSGEGWFIPIVIGKDSCKGKIEEKLKTDEDSATPLQEKLEKIAGDIGKFGLYSGLSIIIALLLRFTIERSIDKKFDASVHIEELIHFILVAIAIIVMAIPEGLPLAVTLSLAFSTMKMLKDKNLVRKLEACETMGGADNICSDKTGTLTQNKMNLSRIWNGQMIEINTNETSYDLKQIIPDQLSEVFLLGIAANNSAEIKEVVENGKKVTKEIGSATEIAFIQFLKKCGINYEDWVSKYEVIESIPFTSSRKMMSRIIAYNKEQRLLIKGASELVLEACTKIHQFSNNQIVDIDATVKESINKAIKDMAEGALRTICVAYKQVRPGEDVQRKDQKGVRDIEKSNLVLIAICGIHDPLRDGVKDAVLACQRAGITVRMVTGDNQNTARAIATECGIITKGSNQLVMLGEDFMKQIGGVICSKCQTEKCSCPRFVSKKEQVEAEKADEKENDSQKKQKNDTSNQKNDELQPMDIEKHDKNKNKDDKNKDKDKEKEKTSNTKLRVDTIKNKAKFSEIVSRLAVLARSRPEDKYALVVGLMENNHVVAVTGDGTNDAPALKKANIGFAMGIAGTQVAKDAADIIITDDNFASIVKAILWGRNIYESIKKFLQFQLTVNIVGVVMTLVSAIVVKQELLQPIQMLWINLIMDTFASLALATEPPNEKLLNRRPHKKDDYMVTPKMFKHIAFQAVFQLTIMFLLAFNGENFLPEYRDSFDENSKFQLNWKYNLDGFNAEKLAQLTLYSKGLSDTRPSGLYVRSGRLKSYNGKHDDYPSDADDKTPSRHFTIVFNAFVFLQFFNFLNAKKIEDEINIFANIFNNMLFFIIMLIILIFQIIFVTFGGRALDCYDTHGLTIQQWLICIGFGIIGIFVSFIAKFFDEHKVIPGYSSEQQPIGHSGILSMKRSKHFEKKLSSFNQPMVFGSKINSQKPPSVRNKEQNQGQKIIIDTNKQE